MFTTRKILSILMRLSTENNVILFSVTLNPYYYSKFPPCECVSCVCVYVCVHACQLDKSKDLVGRGYLKLENAP